MKTLPKKVRGSVLIITVMFTMVIAAVTGSFLHLAMNESRLSNSIMYANNALNLAEAGVERALNALNHGEWNSPVWIQEASDLRVMEDLEYDLGNGATGRIRVHIIGDNMTPTVIARGIMELPNRPDVSRQIEVRLERRRYFANGMTSRNRVRFSGGNARVDSYRSSLGPYNAETNRFFNGSVASNMIIDDYDESIDLGNSQILGYAATAGPGGLRLGPQGKVRGADEVHSPERVAYDYYGEFPMVSVPDADWTYGTENNSGVHQRSLTDGGTFGDPGATETTYVKLDHIDVSGGDRKLEIVSDTVIWVTGDISVTGNAHWDVAEGVSVKIFVDGDITISGSGYAQADKPEDFLFFGTNENDQTFDLSGNGSWVSAVYAPNALVQLSGSGGSGEWNGAVVGKEIQVTGSYQFHYDEDLADFIPEEATFRMERWRELHGAEERYDFAVNTDTESREHWWQS